MLLNSIIRRIDRNLIPFYQYCYHGRDKQYYSIFYNFLIKKQFRQILNIIKIVYIYLLFPFYYIFGSILFLFNVRFFLVDLSQIGSILWLELFHREIYHDKKIQIIICSQKKYDYANNFLINLYKKEFIFIKSFLLRLFFLPFMHINYLTINTKRFEIDNRCSYAHNVWKKSKSSNTFNNLKADLNINHILTNYSKKLKINFDNYVTIHIRDSGFYKDNSRQTRNADIETYVKLISKLQKKGYTVVKLGDKESKKIENLEEIDQSKYFDYAKSNLKSEKNDLIFISQAKFHIATPSGLSLIPMIFNKKSFWTNMNTVSQSLGFIEGDITIFKKLVSINTGKYLPFEKYFKYPFDQNLQQDVLFKIGYRMVNNTNEEIFMCFDDFYNKNFSNITTKSFKVQKYMQHDNYSYNALGEISSIYMEKFYNTNVE